MSWLQKRAKTFQIEFKKKNIILLSIFYTVPCTQRFILTRIAHFSNLQIPLSYLYCCCDKIVHMSLIRNHFVSKQHYTAFSSRVLALHMTCTNASVDIFDSLCSEKLI